MDSLKKLQKLKYNQKLAFGDPVYLASEVEPLIKKLDDRIEYLSKMGISLAKEKAKRLGMNEDILVVPFLLPPPPEGLANLFKGMHKDEDKQ